MKKGMKVFLIFLAVMLFFTVISRATDSFLVPQVTVENPSAKKIEHIVEIVGTVERNLEIPLLTDPDLLIRTVYVSEGETVTEGQLLAEIDTEQLGEQIDALRDEIKILKLQEDASRSAAAAMAEERQRSYARAKEDYDTATEAYNAAVQKAENEKKAAEDALNSFLAQEGEGKFSGVPAEEIEAEKQRLLMNLQEKQEACEQVSQNEKDALLQAKRMLEDASGIQADDHAVQIGAITLDVKERRLADLEKLLREGARITAPQDGTVTGVLISTGQKTSDTAAFTMAVAGGGVKLTASVPKSDASYVRAKDAASVEKNGVTYEDFSVSAIKQKEDGSLEITVEADGNEDVFSIGESVKITVVKRSALYETTVPLAAVHVEQSGSYVYILSEKETVLGTQQFAQKIEISVLEKNGIYAALRDGALGSSSQVIVDSDQYINAGDRVRLLEQ